MSRRGGGGSIDGRLAEQIEDIGIAISELTDKIDILMIQVQSGGGGVPTIHQTRFERVRYQLATSLLSDEGPAAHRTKAKCRYTF